MSENVQNIIRRAQELLAKRQAEHVRNGEIEQSILLANREAEMLNAFKRLGVPLE